MNERSKYYCVDEKGRLIFLTNYMNIRLFVIGFVLVQYPGEIERSEEEMIGPLTAQEHGWGKSHD